MNWSFQFFKGHIKKVIVFFILAVFFLLGFLVVFHSWEGKVYVSLGESGKFRKLAETEDGEGREASFIELTREELKEHGSEQLFVKTKACSQGSLLAFHLGNFIVPDTERRKHFFICDLYKYVEMTFTGSDSSVSGKGFIYGKMVFQAPCISEGVEFIGPFYFPLEAVLGQSEKMKFALEEKNTLVQFYNMVPAMNDNWLLTVARFFNSNDEGEYFVTFIPGEESPFFELHFRESTEKCSPKESS